MADMTAGMTPEQASDFVSLLEFATCAMSYTAAEPARWADYIAFIARMSPDLPPPAEGLEEARELMREGSLWFAEQANRLRGQLAAGRGCSQCGHGRTAHVGNYGCLSSAAGHLCTCQQYAGVSGG